MRLESTIEKDRSTAVIVLGVSALGAILALAFCFLAYPHLQTSQHAILDPDGFGLLGHGLWKRGALCYDPDSSPTINRGPLYPALIALSLRFSGGAYPQAIQFIQSLVFGLTCAGVAALVKLMKADERRALWAGLVCAAHPFLLWYTSRVWVETMAAFLFTGLCLTTLWLYARPGLVRAVLLGALIGAAALTKGLFIIFAPLVPLGLMLVPRPRVPARYAVVVLAVAGFVIAPWTWRNYRLTGKIVPVHVNAGFAALLGNTFIDHFPEAGFRLATLHEMGVERMGAVLTRASQAAGRHVGWRKELAQEQDCKKLAYRRWREDPLFLVRKMALNAVFFWTLGETPLKSAVIAFLQVPLALVFFLSICQTVRRDGYRDYRLMPALWVALYYVVHLPVISCGRYSAVVTPAMIAFAWALFLPPRRPHVA